MKLTNTILGIIIANILPNILGIKNNPIEDSLYTNQDQLE